MLPDVPAFTMAINAARIHHAVTSSDAAQVIAIMPNFVFVRFLSLMILANTGNAVMLIAIPMNNEKERNLLQENEKERAENIMIVDLVRNDLSKICEEGSVSVKELLKIYSFPQVHQIISTITGRMHENISFGEIFSATFPMGSMTGAPKKRAMELIEKYEKTKRGLFSGTVGYINPDGDFDFNVVIRSILYNEKNSYISIEAGSAITWKSVAEKEYEECNIKISAMKKALE